MQFIDHLLGVIAPHTCLACGAEGRLLCRPCTAKLSLLPSRCYRCHRLTDNYRTCKSCRGGSGLRSVHVAVAYEGLAKQLVWKIKFAGARAGAREIAELLSRPPGIESADLIVPVPTAASRVRQRGFDQAKLIARELSRQKCVPYKDCLVRIGQTKQVGATRRERTLQVQGAFRVRRVRGLDQTSILLVDDVLTTGATLEAAAKVLRRAGVRHVDAAVFAQP